MADIITVEWIEARDTRGLIADSTNLEDAILAVSGRICDYIGHDFGDSSSIESIDGTVSSMLMLNGKTKYPLRTLASVEIDDVAVNATNLIMRPTRQMGDLYTSIRLKVGNWLGYTIDIDGVWGWAEIPEEVKEAAYRLIVLELTGNRYGETDSGSDQIKRLKHPDGVEIEYFGNDVLKTYDPNDLGDDYATGVLKKYRWCGCGGVI